MPWGQVSDLVLPALAAGLGLSGLVLCVLRPGLAALLLMVVIATDSSSVLPHVGPIDAFSVALVTAAAALALAVARGEARLGPSPVAFAALAFLAVRALSLVVASDFTVGIGEAIDEVKNLLPLLVLVPLLARPSRLVPLVAAAVAAVAALAGLTAVQEFLLHNSTDFGGFSKVPLGPDVGAYTSRHSGPLDDPNFWGRILVLFLPLSLALASVLTRRAWRLAFWGSAFALVLGCYLTQSRGTALALVAAGGAWILLLPISRRRKGVVLALGVVALLAVPGVASRLATLQLATGGPGSDLSLTDRLAVQKVGIAMSVAHPFLGVGVGNFTVAEAIFRRTDAPTLSRIIAPHNLYLQMLAEGGVLGLIAWLGFFGTAVLVTWRAWLRGRHRSLGEGGTVLAAGVLAGLAGWATASLFLHLANLRILVLLVSIGAALDRRSAHLPTWDRGPAAPAPGAGRPAMRRAAAWQWGGAALVAAMLVMGTAAHLRGSMWRAALVEVLEPSSRTADTAYVEDVAARPAIIDTFARAAQNLAASEVTRSDTEDARGASVRVHVETVTGSAALVISASARSSSAARGAAAAAAAIVRRYADSLDSLYTLGPPPVSAMEVVEEPALPRQAPLLLWGLAVGTGSLLIGERLRGRAAAPAPKHALGLRENSS